MIFTTLALALLAKEPAPSPIVSGAFAGGDHGKIAWFRGSYEEALAQAKAGGKIVFIDFWTSWCGWCKRLDKDTFSDPGVVEATRDVICLSVDAESETGRPIAAKFRIKGYPALFVLGSDGALEDSLGGYVPPAKFKKEIERCRAGVGTVSAFRKAVEADKSDPDRRFRLAKKLLDLGDQQGHDAQMAEIVKLDPEGKSLPMRKRAFDAVIAKINDGFQKRRELDTAAVTAFLANERHPEILFAGNYALVQMHLYLANQAAEKGEDAEEKREHSEARAAMAAAWKHVPEDQVSAFGNTLAWEYYEARGQLSPEEKAFALEVSAKSVEASPDDAHAIDTHACCLFMNGKRDEALKQLERCRDLDPKSAVWRERLAEFQK